MDTINLIFAGVGGQGVLLIAEITALTAAHVGLDVKQTEVHGVSQRGGSVESHVRFGAAVYSPLVIVGQADVVIGLEKLEGLRYASYLRPHLGPPREAGGMQGGVLLVNNHEIIPASVVNAIEKYPYNAIEYLRTKGVHVIDVPASQLARDLGDGRMANMILLGALTTLIDLSESAWAETLNEKLPKKYRDANLRAFEVGKEWLIAHRRSPTPDDKWQSISDQPWATRDKHRGGHHERAKWIRFDLRLEFAKRNEQTGEARADHRRDLAGWIAVALDHASLDSGQGVLALSHALS